jgi:nucleoside-diphosphate-sugar epimerase
MKILVTGAAGFIGFHTSIHLLERGDDVIGIDNLNDYYDVGLKRAHLDILMATIILNSPISILKIMQRWRTCSKTRPLSALSI